MSGKPIVHKDTCECAWCKRRRKKQASRDEDQRRLEAGEVTREELNRENSMFPPEFIKNCTIDWSKIKCPK